jgi:Rieske Fe-S protein
MNNRPANDRGQITRRSFCSRIFVTSVGVGLAANVVSAKTIDQFPPLAYPPTKIDGAERMMPGSSLYFSYPTAGDPAVLIRQQEGEYIAYSRKCAHMGCSVDFDSARQCLKCPCHQGAYDARTGYVVLGPPPRPLDQIVLQVRAGGEVWAVGKRFGSNNHNA